MAYLVSLQFAIPGIIGLRGQVAPPIQILWRASFTFAGVAGAAGIYLLGRSLIKVTSQARLVHLFWWVAVPIYLLIAAVAASPASRAC